MAELLLIDSTCVQFWNLCSYLYLWMLHLLQWLTVWVCHGTVWNQEWVIFDGLCETCPALSEEFLILDDCSIGGLFALGCNHVSRCCCNISDYSTIESILIPFWQWSTWDGITSYKCIHSLAPRINIFPIAEFCKYTGGYVSPHNWTKGFCPRMNIILILLLVVFL